MGKIKQCVQQFVHTIKNVKINRLGYSSRRLMDVDKYLCPFPGTMRPNCKSHLLA